MVYESSQNEFFAFQINQFQGWQRKIAIKNYQRGSKEDDLSKQDSPEVLKSCKEKIKQEIEESSKNLIEKPKLNIYAQLMTGKLDCKILTESARYNMAKRSKAKQEDIHEITSAIILTSMAAKADVLDNKIENLGQTNVVKDEIFKYFRSDYCVYITSAMFH